MRPTNPLRMAQLALLLTPLAFTACGGRSDASIPAPTPYFGQALPGETPVQFAPEKLNALNLWVEGTEFSPDGTLFFVTIGSQDYSTAKMVFSKWENGAWTPFVDAPFLAGFTMSAEAAFSADGKTLQFTGRKDDGVGRLWTVSYTNGVWGTPVALPSPINDGNDSWRGSYTTDGAFYFGSLRLDPANGNMGIYKATKDASQTWTVQLVGEPVTTQAYECDPCVAPDGRFLVFSSARSGLTCDLYVCFRNADGSWGEAILLGSEFNLTRNTVGNGVQEYGPHLSADGKYLFYTRHTTNGTLKGDQILWVATSAIDKYKR